MEIKQLEAYVKVYELQSFSRAADHMFLSQPSISTYINSLEIELGAQLIIRSTKAFLPTKSGDLFYNYAKEMLALRDKACSSILELTSNSSGCIDILASSVPAQYILPKMLGCFHRQYPNISFNVNQMNSSDVIDGILQHKGEIGFVGAHFDNGKCEYIPLISEQLVLIAPNQSQFWNVKEKDIPKLLQDQPFVARNLGSGTRLEHGSFLSKMGIDWSNLRISARFDNTQGILHAVANGLGLAIVSSIAAEDYISRQLVVQVNFDNPPTRMFYIVQKKDSHQTPAVAALIETLVDQTNKNSAQN